MQKDADGTWRPVNAKRPDGWIAGPVPPFDVTRGVCPKCAPDWSALQAKFMKAEPSDLSVKVRPPEPFSIAAKTKSNVPLRVGILHNTNIIRRDDETPRASKIPMMAPAVEQPQVTQAAAAPPPMRQLAGNRGVTMTPNRMIASSAPAVRTTRTASSVPAVRSSPISSNGQVRVVHAGGVPSLVPATTMQRIVRAPDAPSNATAIIPNADHTAGPIRSAPMTVAVRHNPSSGGVVSYSAPVAIEQK